jgi:uncharacterized membrane protein YidH (DUF202 family)
MIAFGAAGVVGFLVYLYAQATRRGASPDERAGVPADREIPLWLQILLALLALGLAIAVLVWLVISLRGSESPNLVLGDQPRALWFLVLMLGIGVAGLVAFVVYLIHRAVTRRTPRESSAGAPHPEGEAVETPAAVRLLGLLVLPLIFLLLNWIYLTKAQEYALMLGLIYPASLAVALVMLFDKATRNWSVKTVAAGFREWMYGDGIVFLLVLAVLNLTTVEKAEDYHAQFWDLLYVTLFFFIFWMLDRKATRYRFLTAQGYLFLLPIWLLIWETVQEVKAPEGDDYSWWSTIWPFFIWAGAFLVLEIIALIASRKGDGGVAQVLKDAVFWVGYGILLIVAVPGGG